MTLRATGKDHRLEERESLPKSELEKSRNKQGPPLSFPNMNSTLPSERSRTVSFPSKSDSRLSTLSPRPSLHRRQHSRSSSRTSSPTGSVFSTGSEMEVIKVDIEHERERNWNAPRPSWHRHPSVTHLSSSNLDMLSPTERPRTLSSPGRPDSRLSTSSSHRSRQRNDSHDSSRSSSRLSSRASSPWIGDVDRLPKQERERDWSSSMPQWNTHSRSASSGNDHSQSHSQIPANPLKRSQSLTQKFSLVPTPAPASPRFSMDTAASTRRRAESLKSSSLQSSPGESPKSRSTSSKPRLLSRPNGYPPRPNSPIPPVVSARPSFNPDSSEPRGGASPEATKLSHSFGGGSYGKSEVHNSPSSHIPVRSLSEVKGTILFLEAPRLSTDGVSQPEEALATEDHPSLSQENQILPPKPRDEKDEIKKTSADITADQADNDHLLEQESTPTLRPNIVLPAFENQEFEAALIRGTLVSETRPQKIITSPPSPPLSSSSESPTTPEPELAHFSLPSTPPSKQSSGSFKLEFRTPSPPRNLPDLPGPPSSISSDYDEITVPAGEFSLLKTPKPPGAWAATPLSSRPIPLRSNSLPTDDEIENGLATPASSLSRAATMSPRTPALPGGWVNTPASRKNVRFFEGPSSLDSEKNTTGRIEDVKSVAIEAPVGPHPPLTSKVTGSHSDGSPKSSRIRSPRKAVTIRVVDAFGREETKKETKEYKLRNDDSVRIVDAMGHTIDDSHDPIPSILDDHPLTRMETLGRVRSSLRELREELTEKEAERVPKDVQDRIRSLQRTSVEARQSRTRLTREMLANTDNLKAKLAPLRASMQRSATSPVLLLLHQNVDAKYDRIFRAARSYAKTKFLTTYYDPLYPDLFFYTSLPTNYCSSPPVLELFQREGLQAAALKALDYIAIVFYSWQLPCHPAFYDNGSSNPNWPPS
ncbi:hypothetical protein D9757_005669 [Collybiopsis confluens]|uniref:Uncharacterized protein n=1 Tax=Collybiopsis confluens TaxID=2823264 RepID=A0A8H5MCE7_9AGAR|nr:hypothetical protein D9757_005669 [Collybiopsis confluens]